MEVHFNMSKLTKEEKIKLYNKRKAGERISSLCKTYKVHRSSISYIIRLIEAHGFDILREGQNRYYSPELKKEMINKVLIDSQSIWQVAIDFGLPNQGLLANWIKVYKDNDYDIVEKKRGRRSTMSKNNQPEKKYEDMTPEEKVLYLENKTLYLEAENQYLKKLRAVVQRRKKQEQKKK